MFSWFKKKSEPTQSPASASSQTAPQMSVPLSSRAARAAQARHPQPPAPRKSDCRISFTNGAREWEEKFNLIDVAARAIEKHGHTLVRFEDHLVHDASGLVVTPTVEFGKQYVVLQTIPNRQAAEAQA